MRQRPSFLTPPPLLVAALVAVVLAAGVGTAAVRDGGGNAASRRPPASGTSAATTTPRTAAPAPAATAGPPTPVTTRAQRVPAPPPTAAQARLFKEIEGQVAALRGLQWKSSLDIAVVSRPQLALHLKEANASESHPERIAGDEAALKLLALIPRQLDYAKFSEALLGEQVLGFYDPRTKQLLVGDAGGGRIDGTTKVAIAHEMDHALTDQSFDFGPRSDALDEQDKEEEAFALSGLLEGDAVLLQRMWEGRFLREGMGSGEAKSSVLDQAPAFIRDALFFPYSEGLDFVTALYKGGGWKAVNDAYGRPPVSTEQILHPELYRAAQGWAPPPVPDLPKLTGCTGLRTGTIGEFQTADLLSEEVEDASAAAAGWDGDAFSVVRCGKALAMMLRWRSDDEAAAARLAAAVAGWARGWSGAVTDVGADGRFSGPKGSGRLAHQGRVTDLVLGDTQAAADTVASAALGR